MHEPVAGSGCVGARPLVARPLFQGAVEPGEQEDQRRGTSRAALRVTTPPHRPPRSWLLPPVAHLRQRRGQRVDRRAVVDALTRCERDGFVEPSHVATGWAMLAVAAFVLGLEDASELVGPYVWSSWVLPSVVVAMLLRCAASTAVRVRHAHDVRGTRGAAAGAGA